MLRRWVFKISKGGFNDKDPHVEEIVKIEACTLNEAWIKLAYRMPVNTRIAEMTGIEYL